MSPEITLPADVWIEKLVLGSVLLDCARNWPTVSQLLQASDFSIHIHQVIFARIAEVMLELGTVDSVLLGKALLAFSEFEKIGGLSYLTSLADGLPQLYNLDAYCEQVRTTAALRNAILTLYAGAGRLSAEGASLDTLGAVKAEINALEGIGRANKPRFKHIADVIDDPAAGGIQSFFQPSAVEIGLPWPWPTVTDAIGGMLPGSVVVLSAATGIGKTTAGTQCVLAASQAGYVTAMLSLEMGDREVSRKLIAQLSGTCLSDWVQGRSTSDDRRRIQASTKVAVKWPIYMDDDPMVTPAALDSRLAAMAETPRLLVVDYLQLMQSGLVDRDANRERHVAHISRQLKLLALKYNLTVMALSQVNAQGETRESSAIQQDATQVVRLDRKEFGEIHFVVLKSRLTARARISLQFDGRTGLFTEGT